MNRYERALKAGEVKNVPAVSRIGMRVENFEELLPGEFWVYGRLYSGQDQFAAVFQRTSLPRGTVGCVIEVSFSGSKVASYKDAEIDDNRWYATIVEGPKSRRRSGEEYDEPF